MPTLADHPNPINPLEALREHKAVKKVRMVESTFDEPVYFQVWFTDDATTTTRITALMSDYDLSIGAASITENGRLQVNVGYDPD